MKKTLLTMLALLCTFTVALGMGTACKSNKGNNSTSSSSQVESLNITGRPTDDTVTITDTVNTLTLGCDETGVTWASSDTAVATVENGVVTLHSAGSTVIRVTKGEKTGEFILTVVDGRIPAPAIVTITGMPQNGEVQLSSGNLQLSATCSDGSEVVWISHNDLVATVDETGKVIFLQPGTVEIVAQKKGESSVYSVCTLNVVTPKANREDFTNAVVIGNYVVGEIECRDASNVLSPEIVYDEAEDNYYLKYSHAKADGNNKYMIYTFGGLEAGARYVLKYNMKVLSQEGAYNHQINLYSDKDIPVAINDPLVGNVYNWHTTGLDTETAKIYQSGSGALYRDGVRWTGSADSADDFHEYTLGFIAGESTVGFAFVGGNTYEVLFDYICVEKAPAVEEYTLTSTTRLPVGESYALTPVAVEDLIYYQPFKLTYTSSDETVATVNEKGVVTALKEGEVTITAKNEKGEEKTANITIVPTVDGSVYNLFYEETDPDVNGNHLYKEYELPETVALDAVRGDKYRVTLDIDAIYYVGNVEMYLGLVNASGALIGHNNWICESFPLSGEKKTVTLEIDLPWASGNFDLAKLQVYLRYGTDYQIGVDVVSIEKTIDPNAANYDLWYVGRTESVSQTYELSEAVTGGVQYDTVEVKLSLNLLEGTMPRIKFYLLNTDGTQVTDPADNGWITVADCYDEATDFYTFTTAFKWATGNWNVGSLWLLAEDGSYRLGVDVVSVKVLEDPNAANYDLWYVGGPTAVEQTYTLTEAVTGGAQYDTAEVKLSFDLVNGTMPRIKFYLLNTDGQQITDPAENGWISVVEGENTVTATFKWATGNWNVGAIKVIAEDGSYRLGVDVVDVKIVKDTTGENYDLWYVGTTESIEQTYELTEAVTSGAQYDTAEVKLSFDLVNGTMPRIKFYLINTEGQQITDPAENGWITVEEGENTVTATFKWATGNWNVGAIKVIAEDGTYRLGVDVADVKIVKDTTGDNYDLWYVGTTESIEQTYELTEAVTGGAQYDTAEVKLYLDLVNGTMPRIKFYLLNTDGQQITDPAENGWISVVEGENTVTATFKWATGNWNVGAIKVIAEDGTYRLGVDVVDVKIVKDTTGENYDLWYVGTTESIEQTYELTEAVTGGAQYDTAEVKLSIDLVNGTMPRIKFYLINTEGQQITDPAENGWITVEEGENTVTATFKWATGNWNVGAIKVIAEDGTYRLGVDVVDVKIVKDTTGENYDLWYVGTTESIEQTYELTEAVTGGIRYDMAEVKLSLDLVNGTMPRIKFYLINTDGVQITDPAENGWITVEEGENTVTATFKWATGNWNVGAIKVIAEDGTYRLGVDVVDVKIVKDTTGDNYDLWYVGTTESIEQTYELTEAVTGGIRYDMAEVKLSLDLVNGTMPRIKFYLLNTDGAQITDPAENGWITVVEDENTVTATFKWATGNWNVGAIKVIAEDGSYRLGVDVNAIEIRETAYQLEYSLASGSQAQVFAFDTVAGGSQNGYVKVTFDIAVFSGTLTNIQFNLCTDTAGSTTVANSNKAWNEDGTKITSSGGQISMNHCTGKKTVTIVTTFPWANGNWDLQSIRLQLYGTNLQAGVSNIQVELVSDFAPIA